MSSVRDSLPIQGLSQWYRESGFPHRKPGLLQVVSEPYLTVARNHSLVDSLGTFYTLYFIYIYIYPLGLFEIYLPYFEKLYLSSVDAISYVD
jgi:hypothetical protein